MKSKLLCLFLLAASPVLGEHFFFGFSSGPRYNGGYRGGYRYYARPPIVSYYAPAPVYYPPAPYYGPSYDSYSNQSYDSGYAPSYEPDYGYYGGYYGRPPFGGAVWFGPRYYGGRYYRGGYWGRRR